jgi:hypothetical protein
LRLCVAERIEGSLFARGSEHLTPGELAARQNSKESKAILELINIAHAFLYRLPVQPKHYRVLLDIVVEEQLSREFFAFARNNAKKCRN